VPHSSIARELTTRPHCDAASASKLQRMWRRRQARKQGWLFRRSVIRARRKKRRAARMQAIKRIQAAARVKLSRCVCCFAGRMRVRQSPVDTWMAPYTRLFLRKLRQTPYVCRIQAAVRGWMQRKIFHCHKAALIIQVCETSTALSSYVPVSSTCGFCMLAVCLAFASGSSGMATCSQGYSSPRCQAVPPSSSHPPPTSCDALGATA